MNSTLEKRSVRESSSRARHTLLLILATASLTSAANSLAAEAGATAGGAEAAPFDIFEFRVLGNSVLSNTSIEAAVMPHLGRGKSFADVQAASQALERAYKDAGFGTVFVDIPEQTVDQGVVRLRVTEGRLDRVRVTGARYFSNRDILKELPAVASGAVPNLTDVQRELGELNRVTADRLVTPVLKAGRSSGTTDIELKVTDKPPLHASIEVNDRYSADTSRLRASASLSFTNLFQRQHTLSLQYQTAPEEPNDVRAAVASYIFTPVAWPEITMALYAVDSSTDVAALGTLSVLGSGQVFGFRVIRALHATPRYQQSLTLGADYKDFLENIQLDVDQSLVTPIRYMNLSTGYSGTLRSTRMTNSFNATANFGIRGVFNDTREFSDKRFHGVPNYFYVRGGWQQLLQLPAGLQLFTRLSAQLSRDALVSNEQLSMGGVDTVRGYLESSRLGDFGAGATLELRGTWPSRWLRLPAGGAYLLLFADSGALSIRDPLPSQPAHYDLASVGAGLRVTDWHGLDVAADWAHALSDTGTGTVESGDNRVHFSVRYGL